MSRPGKLTHSRQPIVILPFSKVIMVAPFQINPKNSIIQQFRWQSLPFVFKYWGATGENG
jgi:hypothetical protein